MPDPRPIRHGPYPELTWPGILVGYVLGALIAITLLLVVGSDLGDRQTVVAAVMNEFAAGERHLNRVWSASVDGYGDEVREYLSKARQQFERTRQALDRSAF